MRLLLFLIVVVPLLSGATTQIVCGGPLDNGFVGGAVFVLPPTTVETYQHLRYGTAFSYAVQDPAGPATLTLQFMEPNQTAIGGRTFSVVINGTQVLGSLDLFAVAGLLKPYEVTFPVTSTGTISLLFIGVKGNAVVSGIKIVTPDPVAPGTTQTGALIQCFSGTIPSTILTTSLPTIPGSLIEIPVFPVGVPAPEPAGFPSTPLVGVDWRYDHVLLCETQQFLGPSGVTYNASMGLPGTNDYELTGTWMSLGAVGGSCWYSRPSPPAYSSAYSVVVAVTSTGDLSQLTAGQLTWEICGYSALMAGAISIPLP